MAVIDRDRWRTLEPLLDEALELSAEDRASWLGALHSRSPELAADLAALLSGEATADRRGFLAEPLAVSLEGLRLGAYELERPLGRGGMGSVWLARRTDGRFEGVAAVKLLDLGALSETAQQRFRREGSVLARLTHPGIARLLDAGVTPGGQPYLVLEYVDGEPIDAYADARRLSVEERVRLVLQLLAAVGHAHASLVVHRDLKPSNVLVAADGTAKLLDFGIAKLLDAEGAEDRIALTDVGARALTPKFAAPEQVAGGAITTATDVYALGVLLYVLLTGRHPYELGDERSAAEVERVVREVEPPRPSSTFEGGGGPRDGDDRVARARARGGSTPERLRRQLRGDLDVIVLKALRKEPERRYESAAALADDLRRFLDGRPVLARPDGAAYRARKFVGRHRGALAVVAAGVVLLAGAGVRERTLRARAEAQAETAKAVEQYLIGVFGAADPYAPPESRPRDITARALLDRGARTIDTALAGEPAIRAELRGALGRVYADLGLYDGAAAQLRRSLAERRAVYGARHPEVAEAMDQLGQVLLQQGRLDEADTLLRAALGQRRQLFGDRNDATAESLTHLAALLENRDDFAAAEPLFREALATRRALHGDGDLRVAAAKNALAEMLHSKGANADAVVLYRQALATRERRLGEDHPLTASTMEGLAATEELLGHYAEAERLYRRALAVQRKTLGNAHRSVTLTLNDLGQMLFKMGRAEEAESLLREALALNRQIFGEKHDAVSANLSNLALIVRERGDFDEAERLLRQALAIDRALYGPEHVNIGFDLNEIAVVLRLNGRSDSAVTILREALAQSRRLVGENDRGTLAITTQLAKALRETGQLAESERLFRDALRRLDPNNEDAQLIVIPAQVGLGRTLTDMGRPAEALPLLEQALPMSRSRLGADHWRTAEAQLALGECLAALRQYARAEPLLREADATLERQRRAQPPLAADARSALARLDRALGRRPANGAK